MVSELMWSIGWVRARETPSSSDNGQHKDAIIYLKYVSISQPHLTAWGKPRTSLKE